MFEKREMTVNGEGNGWSKKVETIESVSEKYFFFMLKATRELKKKEGDKRGECCEKCIFFYFIAEGNPRT